MAAFFGIASGSLESGERASLRYWWDMDTVGMLAALLPLTIPYALILGYALGHWPLAAYLGVTTLVVWLLFWLPTTAPFRENHRIYLRKPNKYIDIYEDSRSAHWVSPPPSGRP